MDTAVLELDYRHSGRLDLYLLWHRDLEAVSLTIQDSRSGRSLELPVANDRALKAFRHPFATPRRLASTTPPPWPTPRWQVPPEHWTDNSQEDTGMAEPCRVTAQRRSRQPPKNKW
jgi:hypothetical protein